MAQPNLLIHFSPIIQNIHLRCHFLILPKVALACINKIFVYLCLFYIIYALNPSSYESIISSNQFETVSVYFWLTICTWYIDIWEIDLFRSLHLYIETNKLLSKIKRSNNYTQSNFKRVTIKYHKLWKIVKMFKSLTLYIKLKKTILFNIHYTIIFE